MKNVIFIFCLFVTVTVVFSDDFAEQIANSLGMSRTNVQTCINKTHVQMQDLMRIDQLVDDNVETIDINKSTLKVSCFLACLMQKIEMMSGAYINEEKLKKLLHPHMNKANDRDIAVWNQILDKCIDRVKSKTDECDVALKFSLCFIVEMKRLEGTQI